MENVGHPSNPPMTGRNACPTRSQGWLQYFFFTVALVVVVLAIALEATSDVTLRPSALTEHTLDLNLQRAATAALGERRGTVIIMDRRQVASVQSSIPSWHSRRIFLPVQLSSPSPPWQRFVPL